ncbi:MAG: hypothetical protein VB064_02390 [Oscillospiraceae bacterium]|nr:hypothetical protein [Oscillospiraceae bacterium]
MEVKHKLSENTGSIMVESALVCLIGLMLLAVCIESACCYLTISMIRNKTDSAVLSVAAANVANIYDGVRESAGNAREISAGDWSEYVATDDVRSALADMLSLTESGENHMDRITSENGTAYIISGLKTSYVNNEGDDLNFMTTLTVTIPLHFLNINLNQNLEVKTTYEARF